jgi:hypothetical protein
MAIRKKEKETKNKNKKRSEARTAQHLMGESALASNT